MRSVVLLGGVGALIFWLTGVTGNTAADDAAELERLHAGAGVSATGTMTGVREREQRSGGKRPRVRTVFCPIYTFPAGPSPSTIVGEGCEGDRADLPKLGSTVPVIYDPDGHARFIDTDEVAADLSRGSAAFPWYRWGSLALAILCGAALLWAIAAGIVRRVRRTPATQTDGSPERTQRLI